MAHIIAKAVATTLDILLVIIAILATKKDEELAESTMAAVGAVIALIMFNVCLMWG